MLHTVKLFLIGNSLKGCCSERNAVRELYVFHKLKFMLPTVLSAQMQSLALRDSKPLQ